MTIVTLRFGRRSLSSATGGHRVAATLAALVLLICRPAAADDFDSIRDKIRLAITRQNIPSVAVAVARDGQILWEEGFGWADREKRRPATEHTMYSLASISKPITATGLMVLVESGKIDLDKPANDYLGEGKLHGLIGDASAATVRRVANHTAGLPMYYQAFFADEPLKAPRRDETIRRYGILVTEPGERYHYANLGYGVLDEIITRVSGKPYADYMREEVFLPLGLTHMSVEVGPGLEEYAAVRYEADGLPLVHYEFDHPGASAVYASAHDLVRFGMFHLKAHLADQKPILTDSAIDAMQVPTNATAARNKADYGIGWTSGTMAGHRVVSHSGGMPGASTLLLLVPEHKTAVVVLVNSRSPLLGGMVEQILKKLLPAAQAKPAETTEEKTGASPAAGDGEPGESPEEPQPSLASAAGTYKGVIQTYEGELPVTLWVLPSGDIHLQIDKQLKSLVNDPHYDNGWIRGRLLGEISTADCRRYPHDLMLDLKHRGERITGTVTAIARPVPRGGYALPHGIDVRREKDM